MPKKNKNVHNYTFWVPITGTGSDAKDAWENAIGEWAMNIPANPPQPEFGQDEDIPAAEILGGNLANGFTVDLGPDEP